MQTLSTALTTHLGQEVTTVAQCWSIKRKDGVTFYFTDHDQDIIISGHVYEAANSMNPSAVSSQSGLAVDNLEFEGMLSADAITEADLVSGKYDHAELTIFMVNYADPSMGTLPLKSGWLGEVVLRGGQFVAEMRGLTSQLQQSIGDVYTNTCRATLGDTKCGIDLSAFTFTGTVTGTETANAFTDSSKTQPNDYFANGVVHFTSGTNYALSMEVRYFNAGRFGLFLPMPSAILIGDAFSVSAGCDKQFDTCVSKFNNAVNFRGEPDVPGTDKLLETAATRST